MRLSNFDDEGAVYFEEPVEHIFGVPVTPEFLIELGRIGITSVSRMDDVSTLTGGYHFKATADSPVGRIMRAIVEQADSPESIQEAVGETLDRIITDVSSGQFEANWPEYL